MVTRRTVLQHAGSIALVGSVPSWIPSARAQSSPRLVGQNSPTSSPGVPSSGGNGTCWWDASGSVATQTGTATSLNVYVQSGSGHSLVLGLYDSSGHFLAKASLGAVTSGLYSGSITPTSIISGNKYYLVWQASSSIAIVDDGTQFKAKYTSNTFGSMPATIPISGGTTGSVGIPSIWAAGSAGGGGGGSGGGGDGGFTAAAGVTTSGTFADSQAFTFHVAAGGLGARANPLWLVYYPFESSFSTHPTLSRTRNTMVPATTNTVISALNPPTNAPGSVAYIPVPGGGFKSSAFSNNGASAQMLCDLHSTGPGFKMYSFQKRRYDFANNPNNDKMFRVWPNPDANGYPNGYFSRVQTTGEHNGNVEFAGSHTGLGAHSNFVPDMPGPLLHTWHTDEFYGQEGTPNRTDGIWNWARQGVMAYALAGRWLMNATGRTPPQNANMFRGTFLDQVTNTPPNGTTDTGRTGITVVDDSWLQLILTDETGGVYHWGQTNTAEAFVSNREAQPQTLRTDTDVTIAIRKGSFSSLSGISAYAITGYGTAIYLGTGI